VFKASLIRLDKTKRQLEVKLKIKNNGKSSIVIDKKMLLYSTEFRQLPKNLPDGGISDSMAKVTTGDPAHPYEGDYIRLRVNESFVITRTFNLNKPFFEVDREFRYSATYGQFMDIDFQGEKVWKGTIQSHELNFRL
jgi:hypothetical protein